MSLKEKLRRHLRRFRRTSGPKGRDDRAEAGETLVEVLLALIILSLASVAMITAFATDISASAEHRSLANFDTALANSLTMTTTVMQDQQYAPVFAACPDPTNPLAQYPTSDTLTTALDIPGYTATIAPSGSQPAVEYTDGNSFSATCSADDVGEPQLINVVVADKTYSQSSTVVVIDPTSAQNGGGQAGDPNGTISLEFIVNPVGGPLGSPLTVQPRVGVLDDGVLEQNAEPSLTLSLTPASVTNGASMEDCESNGAPGGIVTFRGCTVDEIGNGYTLTATLGSGSTAVSATSGPFGISGATLATPTNLTVVPSTTTAGALTITFGASSNAPAGQIYTAQACTDVGMSANCSTPADITSGSDLTGLNPGTSYWVQVTATESSSFIGSTTAADGPTMATVKLNQPGAPSLTQGPVAGSLNVAVVASSGAPPSQTYTVLACTTHTMTNCVTNGTFSAGNNVLTGLTYTPGAVGTAYYVDVTANASPGYLVSLPSSIVLSPTATSAVKTPTGFSTAPSASQEGAITAAFTEPGGGVGPSSFTATVCPTAAITSACITSSYVSGAQLSGLNPGSSYYVQITAVSSTAGYVSATTAFSSATLATSLLAAPTNVTVGAGGVAGSVLVSFTPSTLAPVGQTYSLLACTNSLMKSPGCTTSTNFVPGSDLTGLTVVPGSPGTQYFVEVTANGSSGYLTSDASTQASGVEESEIGAPGTPSVNPGSARGSILVTFGSSTGTAPVGYTARACTGAGMTGTCSAAASIVSGGQITGLKSGTYYYVQITANGPTGYAPNTSSISARGQAR